MNNVVDLTAIRDRVKQKKETYENVDSLLSIDEEEATHMAVMMTADLVDFLERMGITLDSNPESMRDVYMIIDNVKALILRMQNMTCETHKINDAFVNFIDVDEHLQKFRTILNES